MILLKIIVKFLIMCLDKKKKKTDILKFYKVDETITKTKLLFNLDELENLSYLNVIKQKKYRF